MDETRTGCGCGDSREDHDHDLHDGCGCGDSHEGHRHDHHEGCGCGDSHEGHRHDHHDGCGCGDLHEGHHHDHHDECGCGHSHDAHDGDNGPDYDNGLSVAENNVLMALMERGALPVAQFTLTSSKEPEAYAVAMQPVYVASPDDSLDTIREYGNLFTGIAEKGLIELNYDAPLPGYPYDEYWKSEAFRHFTDTSKEAKQRGFTFDTPHLELGSITLSEKGHSVLDRMLQ